MQELVQSSLLTCDLDSFQSQRIIELLSPRDQCRRHHRLHSFAALVRCHILDPNNPVARLRSRLAKIENLSLQLQAIVRFHCGWPAQLIHSKTDRSFRKVQGLNKESHGDRLGVPTTRDEFAKHRSFGNATFQMKRLRINLACEGNDLLFPDCVSLGLKSISA